MSLANLVAQQVKNAFDLLGDIPGLGTYTVKNPSTYTPGTDVLLSNDTAITNVKMVKASLTAQEMEANPLTKTTCKFLIASLNLPGVTCKKTDTIIFQTETWEIFKIGSPPSSPLWILYCTVK